MQISVSHSLGSSVSVEVSFGLVLQKSINAWICSSKSQAGSLSNSLEVCVFTVYQDGESGTVAQIILASSEVS